MSPVVAAFRSRPGRAPVARGALTVAVGRGARFVTRLRGGGTALPGLIVEKLDPGFVSRALGALPLGVVVVSGTNGKTTTTRLVAELLRGQGLAVFTNPSGSNYSRGVASALLGQVDSRGRLRADVAVLELDEAHGVRFAEQVPPRFALLLNVFRDQLDRFGEIDSTARMLGAIAGRTTGAVVLNREDRRVAAIAGALRDTPVRYFGTADALVDRFPGDDELHTAGGRLDRSDIAADVVLTAIEGAAATFEFDGRSRTVDLRLTGGYNMLNAAAAIALVRAVLGEAVDEAALLRTLSTVTPAFGRGETVEVGGTIVELVLVKNPIGFRLALESYAPEGCTTMIAINDHDNDSRDVSWLWDVDFSPLRGTGVAVVTGTRAAEMALRLRYDDIEPPQIVGDPGEALDHLVATSEGRPIRAFCTYTAMLQLRRHLATVATLDGIDR
ncbi:MAG TPA: MurT ligase domain-containing protein [Amnibacterium sp.]|uniref:MurT ligase domain-containing protein n=1 Tax=Amnibacterium sp. TaxID=1872496 RepID=UPI002F951862